MKKFLSDTLRDTTILSVASLVLGALLLFFPGISGRVIASLCALALVVYGGVHTVLYFMRRSPADMVRYHLAKGLVCLLLGLYLLLRPQVLLNFLPVALGLAVLVDSAVRLQKAFDLARMKAPAWWVVLLMALATGVLGLVILLNPFTVAATLIMFLGLGLLVNGLSDLWTLRAVRRQLKDLKDDRQS